MLILISRAELVQQGKTNLHWHNQKPASSHKKHPYRKDQVFPCEWLISLWFYSGEGFCPDRAAHLSKARHEGDRPALQCLHGNSQEVENWCWLNTMSFAWWIHPWQDLWVIPPFCTRPECGDLGWPQRWLQLRHHQRLEGSASEERPQVSLADRGWAGHDRSREDALCIRQVRDSLIMTLKLLVNSPFKCFFFQIGSLSTDVRWFPALFQAQLNHSTLKKISISARRRSNTSNTFKSLVHVRCYIWYPSCFLVVIQALEVSDHFPVEVDLKPNHRYLLRNELWTHYQTRNQDGFYFMNFGCHNKSILSTDFD